MWSPVGPRRPNWSGGPKTPLQWKDSLQHLWWNHPDLSYGAPNSVYGSNFFFYKDFYKEQKCKNIILKKKKSKHKFFDMKKNKRSFPKENYLRELTKLNNGCWTKSGLTWGVWTRACVPAAWGQVLGWAGQGGCWALKITCFPALGPLNHQSYKHVVRKGHQNLWDESIPHKATSLPYVSPALLPGRGIGRPTIFC